MSFDTSYIFPFSQEEVEMVCCQCKFEFKEEKFEGKVKPYYLPCSDLICEGCFVQAKTREAYDCPTCHINYKKSEMSKIRYNKQIANALMNRNETRLSLAFNCYQHDTLRSASLSTCEIHKKENIQDLYCFFHKKKICADCLVEHQYTKCILKKFTKEDSEILLNCLKSEYIKMNDLTKAFSDSLTIFENKLQDESQFTRLNIFSDHSELTKIYNKIVESNSRRLISENLTMSTFLHSSLELSKFNLICEKLKIKTIITNSHCLKFLTNNFKIGAEFPYVEKTVVNFTNLLIHAYNRYNFDSKFYVKYHGDFYLVENLDNEDTRLVLLETALNFTKKGENEYPISVDNCEYSYYDIFIFDNLFQIVSMGKNSDLIKILYSNEKYYIFDFLTLFEVNNNNYLKIGFRIEERNVVNNLYVKIVKYASHSEYLVDYFVVDTNPLHFCKVDKKAKLKTEGSFCKIFFIEREFDINNGKINIYLDSGNISGKIESVTYFKLINC